MQGNHYRAGLDAAELLGVIDELVGAEREVRHLLCRYLADLADRFADDPQGALAGYSDVYHAAKCLFGLNVRKARERVRIGRALRDLAGVEAAFVTGELGYTEVREVTRVATPENEAQWVEAAQSLTLRQLEQRVAEAGSGEKRRERANDKAKEPASLSWLTGKIVEVRFTMSAADWGLLERAMEGARMADEVGAEGMLSDGEALGAVARDALARQQADAGNDAADPRRTVVIYECSRCRESELDTGAGVVALDGAAAATLGCGATERDLAREGRVVARGRAVPAAVKRAVRLRDRNRCRVSGCGRRRYVDVHHIEHREAGGVHSRQNLCVLCTTHHRMLHEGALSIAGDADGELTFTADGEPLCATPPNRLGDPQGSRDYANDPLGPCRRVDPLEAQIVALVGKRGGWHADALVEATGRPYRELANALVTLELTGQIVQSCGFVYPPAGPGA